MLMQYKHISNLVSLILYITALQLIVWYVPHTHSLPAEMAYLGILIGWHHYTKGPPRRFS